MTDHELLELAAKAYGELEPISEIGWIRAGSDVRYAKLWNPLADDGDALRLRNAMQMTIIDEGGKVCAEVARYPVGGVVHEPYERDLPGGFASQSSVDAAVRRAIVRAAAVIGRAMP